LLNHGTFLFNQGMIIFVYKQDIMPEVTIKYKSESALKALHDLAKVIDISIGKPVESGKLPKSDQYNGIPITFAKKPNVSALAGIWEGRDIDLEQLRKEAWGERI
jgi:hypothetical protein